MFHWLLLVIILRQSLTSSFLTYLENTDVLKAMTKITFFPALHSELFAKIHILLPQEHRLQFSKDHHTNTVITSLFNPEFQFLCLHIRSDELLGFSSFSVSLLSIVRIFLLYALRQWWNATNISNDKIQT